MLRHPDILKLLFSNDLLSGAFHIILLKMTEDPKMLSFIGILYIDKATLEIEMEKHLKYLLIYFKFKTTLLFIS